MSGIEKTMRVISLTQQKGGVGKTTVCVNLACQAVARKKRAVILDMDEQGAALAWSEKRKAHGLEEPQVFSVKTPELKAKLAELEKAGVDWAFIDLPGRIVYGGEVGLSHLSIVPARPLEDDIGPSLKTVKLLRDSGRRYAYLLNISPPQVDKARAKKVAEVLKGAGHPVAPVIVVQRIGVPDANARGLGVNEREPSSASAKEYSQLFDWVSGQFK